MVSATTRRIHRLGLLALLAACGEAPEGASPALPAGTPVVLVSIDTLRSDHLPAYGYKGVATPAIDRLRADAVLFTRAYAHVSLTLPSHTTLLTGRLPAQTGVRDNLGYRLDAAAVPFLPRLLRESGYATGGFVSAYVLRRSTGLAEDFDTYDDRIAIVPGVALGGLQRPGAETLDVALDWLAEARARPFFLFLHLYEPHSPYEPPEPWASRYASAYDAEIAAADAVVGRLLERLREWDLYEGSLIVLLSDHGEGLGEHGEKEHEFLLHREALQVPLLVKLPGGQHAGTSVAEPAQLSDVLPTVTSLLGLPTPGGLAGRPLFAAGEPAERAILAENVYGRLHFGWSEMVSVIRGPFHLIHGPDPELYDISADPGETRNLIGEQATTAHALRRALAGVDLELQPPAAVDAETRAKLEALGYVATFAAASDGPRPNPKSKLGIVEELGQARHRAEIGDHAGAVEICQRLVTEEPQLVDAWEALGLSLRRLGRPREAIDALRRAVELSGGAPYLSLALAEAYADAGELAEARAHAEIAVATHDVAPDLLARIALREDDYIAAERWATEAVARRGSRVGPLITLADLRLEQGRLPEALEITAQAEREAATAGGTDPELVGGLYFVRGKALAQQQHPQEAIAAFEREIANQPDFLPSYTHLAYLQAALGGARAAGATLRRLVEANPNPEGYAAAVKTLREMRDEASAAAVLREARRRWPQAPELAELAG